MCFLVKSFGFLPGPNLYGCEITLPVTTGRYHEGIGVLSGGLGFVTLPSTMVSTWQLRRWLARQALTACIQGLPGHSPKQTGHWPFLLKTLLL